MQPRFSQSASIPNTASRQALYDQRTKYLLQHPHLGAQPTNLAPQFSVPAAPVTHVNPFETASITPHQPLTPFSSSSSTPSFTVDSAAETIDRDASASQERAASEESVTAERKSFDDVKPKADELARLIDQLTHHERLQTLREAYRKHDRQLLPVVEEATTRMRGSQRLQNDVAECEAHVAQLNGLADQLSSCASKQKEIDSERKAAAELAAKSTDVWSEVVSQCETWLRYAKQKIADGQRTSTTLVEEIQQLHESRVRSLEQEKHDAALRTVERIYTMRGRLAALGTQRSAEAVRLQEEYRHMDDYDPRVESTERRLEEIDTELKVLRSNFDRLGELDALALQSVGDDELALKNAIHQVQLNQQEKVLFEGVMPNATPSLASGGGLPLRRGTSMKRARSEEGPVSALPPPRRTAVETSQEDRPHPARLTREVQEQSSRRGLLGTFFHLCRRVVYDDGEEPMPRRRRLE